MAFRIELKNVTKQFGEFAALRRVTGEVREGDRIALVGHNGAGKSTLLNLVAGLTRPSEGEVLFFDGEQRLAQKKEVRKRLSYLSHEGMLYPDLTALENLRFTARLYQKNLSEDMLIDLLKSVGMARAKDRLFRTCSRGMQQRLSLARALLPDPRLLLLDEPFAGLDHEGLDRMVRFLDKSSLSWLMVSHDLRLAHEMATKIWIFHKGKLAHQIEKQGLALKDFLALCRAPSGGPQ